ncbi:endonuclease IV [Candidatus Mancarchaeum acidiphilum]|uniref:Probable endonuclease 4 n=1 Tax=Candidatus Mancarchaeum acidiphilum TaxID=1920749 RepID=A0A218NMX4_9ARCH|nr:deoxyribonuclease IV [Candidatus Mancarchaeum acidiphilum]ASI13812.1 endonuclease IV [Candidatus Mancarchaeum acidiphilum]
MAGINQVKQSKYSNLSRKKSGKGKDVDIRLGFHMSVAGSVSNAPLSAGKMGYGDFQFFPSSPRTWKHSPIKDEDISLFKEYTKKFDLMAFAHLPYLFNLASKSREQRSKSIGMLNDNLERCDVLGVRYLVVHLGSHMGSGFKEGRKRISDSLNEGLEKHNAMILFENTAGYRNGMGSSMPEIADISDNVNDRNIGLCLDTCHAFAAGYDLRSEKGVSRLADEIGDFGKRRLKLVHLNDAKYDLGSGLDRHWHLGKGKIGEKGFVNLFENPLFQKGCFVMETPVSSEGDEEYNYNEAVKIIEIAGKNSGKELSCR